jgi:hypothetical protein
MMDYVTALNTLAGQITAQLGVTATRDPSAVAAICAQEDGCILIGIPTHVQRLMGGANLELPVTLIAKAPASLANVDWLLVHMDDFVALIGAKSVSNTPIDIGEMTFPAITAIAQITLEV